MSGYDLLFPPALNIKWETSGRRDDKIPSRAGHELEPSPLQRVCDLLFHWQCHVREQPFDPCDFVAHPSFNGDPAVAVLVQPFLAAVPEEVQPFAGVRGRWHLREGASGSDHLGLAQTNPTELFAGRSPIGDWAPVVVAEVGVGQQAAADCREEVLVIVRVEECCV
ncbi:hypothetical protein ACIOEW_28150 [Streptomyces sp. NPDC087901]|uniref:hypothetical protein n=1 Tax=Streptomyces sp. NPDC087901 TaxID=3365818 RepID=UPI00381790E3